MAYDVICHCGWIAQVKTWAAAQDAIVRHRLDVGPQHAARAVPQRLEAPLPEPPPFEADAIASPPDIEKEIPEHAAGQRAQAPPIEIGYRFVMRDGQALSFPIRLQSGAFRLLPEARADYPSWTALDCAQCPNCPLAIQESPRCPPAVGLIPIVEAFRNWWSNEEAEVTVTTPDRVITKRTALQNALSGLMGLVMVTSGCPILDKLRPLAFIHMPFGGLEETLYRAATTYLLGQAFREARGLAADRSFAGLVAVYTEIRRINQAFAQRLGAATSGDAALNALIHLDCYAQYASSASFRRRLADFEPLYEGYWREVPSA